MRGRGESQWCGKSPGGGRVLVCGNLMVTCLLIAMGELCSSAARDL